MTDYVTVAGTDELPPGEGLAVSVDGEGIAVFNAGGEYHAVANACTHAGGSLGNGRLDGTTVTCPLHGARFSVETGEVIRPPADEPVRTYDVEVAEGEVRVRV